MIMKYRLALDLGSTSLGWCLLETSEGRPVRLIDSGARIFPDGRDDKSKEPLAVARRNARGMRRNLDRRDLRQKRLMSALIRFGFMPAEERQRKNLENLDPYELRAKALGEEIPLHHIGRALFHLNQRRGFKSNRKTDKRENESSNMKNAIKDLDQRLMTTNSRTLGEYLWSQRKAALPVRVRTHQVKGKNEYNFYPGREMYLREVDAILTAQKAFHPELTDEACAEIKDIIFHQRPLRPQLVGKCRFENREDRARLALPIVQKFRILQEVNNLEIERLDGSEPSLTAEQRKKIVDALLNSKKKSFHQIKILLNLPRHLRFNLESEKRTELKGDETSAILEDGDCFGDRWKRFTAEEQEKIIELLFKEDDPDELVRALMRDWGLSKEQAEKTAGIALPDGHGSLSKKAIMKMTPFLEQGYRYSDAAKMAGYHHSDFRTGEIFDRLPYYGEALPNNVIGGTYSEEDRAFPEKFFGKINNPSVHIALNQVRKLVNAVIDSYGHPDEIVIEMARDLKEPPDSIEKEQTKNRKENERINNELEKLGVPQNYRNRMLFKLWEDLAKEPEKRCCPFCADPNPISITQVFNGECEEEHILPFSRSYNDSRANKTIAHRACNRRKGNRSPFEAFGHMPEWREMTGRIQNLPTNKQWRFKEDAWEQMEGKDGVIARMLNDTRYMARLTKQYLSAIFDNEKGRSRVWAIPGQMTALLRKKWGLNDLLGEEDGQKERADHRHHAIDAMVIGCTDRGVLQMLSKAASALENDETLWEKRRKLVSDLPEPFESFREQCTRQVADMVVSYKPDHGGAAKAIRSPRPYTVAGLHDQTAYGLIRPGEKKGAVIVATRKPLLSFQKLKNIQEIADPVIRSKLVQALDGIKENSAEWKQTLEAFSSKHNVRRVRVHTERSEDTLIGVIQPKDRGKDHAVPYKHYALGGNYCAEIYCPDKGKKAGKWQCEIISNYHAHQKDFIPAWRKEHPTARLVMRLHINDMVAYEEDGKTVHKRVRKLNKPNRPVLVDPLKAKLEQNEGWAASPGLLQEKNARKISIDVMGRVKDPVRMKKKSQAA